MPPTPEEELFTTLENDLNTPPPNPTTALAGLLEIVKDSPRGIAGVALLHRDYPSTPEYPTRTKDINAALHDLNDNAALLSTNVETIRARLTHSRGKTPFLPAPGEAIG